MTNPFEEIVGKKKSYEDVEGVFNCQERGCYEVVREAKHFVSDDMLAWQCGEGHISKMKWEG